MGAFLDAVMDLIFLAGVVWTISRTIRGIMGSASKNVRNGRQSGQSRAANARKVQTVRDPVCGMFVSTEVSHKLTIGNEVLHFCSRECLESYERKAAKVS
jgi:YHS domain-containing protein